MNRLLTRENLYSYQKEVVELAYQKKRMAVFIKMGGGKTIIALSLIERILRDKPSAKILIIALKNIINSVWVNEPAKWNFTSHLKIKPIQGDSYNERTEFLRPENNIYAIAPSLIRWYRFLDHPLKIRKWDLIVVDESSLFKNYRSERFQMLIRYFYNYMLLLTGLPLQNNLMDLWSQIYLLDRGIRLKKNITKYRKSYFVDIGRGNYSKYVVSDQNISLIIERIKDIVFVVDKKYTSPGVKIKYIDFFIDMDEFTLKKYKILEKDFIFSLEELKKDSENIVANGVFAKLSKLLQLCNGFIYDQDRIAYRINTLKIEQIKRLIAKFPSENVIIAYNYREDLNVLKTHFPDAKTLNDPIGIDEIINQWNNNKIKMLLIQPRTGGYGLNLQNGGRIIIWYGVGYSLEFYNQTNTRVWRKGQKGKVYIIHILHKKKIDFRVMKIVRNKDFVQENFLEELKKSFELVK